MADYAPTACPTCGHEEERQEVWTVVEYSRYLDEPVGTWTDCYRSKEDAQAACQDALEQYNEGEETDWIEWKGDEEDRIVGYEYLDEPDCTVFFVTRAKLA